MSKTVWTAVDRIWCDRMKQEAELLEQRVYPGDLVPDVDVPFQVRARKCSFDIECNLAGFTCRWAFSNPNGDPFG
jgi:hypothetical protein